MTLSRLCGLWLAVVLLVPETGAAADSALFCDDMTARHYAARINVENAWSLRGFFVDPARPTRIALRLLPDEQYGLHKCFLQHEDGPVSELWGQRVNFAGLCRDPVSGRDHVRVALRSGGSGVISALEYWSVHPATQQLTLEYSQNHLYSESEARVAADSQCQWRQQKAARAVFDAAMAALRTGIELEEAALDIAVGDSLTLPTRLLSAATVRHWLAALRTQAGAFARIEILDVSDGPPAPRWRIVQILGREQCRAPGVVLVHDPRSGQWRALYAVHTGCTKTDNYPLLDMVLTGDTLLASACIRCRHWGPYGAFAIDLKTHRITRVAPAAD